MALEMTCPICGSHDMAKNGMSHRGKQHYQCRDCGRQFVEDPRWQPKPKETKARVNRVLQEKSPLPTLPGRLGVSESWRQGHAHAVYEAVPQTATVIPKPTDPLTVQMDELWSFVDHQGNKQWVWLAVDAETREIISRQRKGEQAIWQRRFWEHQIRNEADFSQR
jgi:insertion element IS1 protein InsB